MTTSSTQANLPASEPLPGNREVLIDKYFSQSITDQDFKFKLFTRLGARSTIAKPVRFVNVRFDHSIFEGCYIRDCVFDSCHFVGCRFSNSNFHGSKFLSCKFEYATFDKTQIDSDILDQEAPREENLKMRFARSLRMNFQQLGDARAVNKAISLELRATELHLFKSWASNETYYLAKYGGLRRVGRFFRWLDFKIFDFLWGNGESIPKLFRSIVLSIIAIALTDTVVFTDPYNLHNLLDSLVRAPAIFFGLDLPPQYGPIRSSTIAATRLTLFALFTAILVKRFSRR